MDIINLQNELLYNIDYYQNKFLYSFNNLINSKTGEIFTSSLNFSDSIAFGYTPKAINYIFINSNFTFKIVFNTRLNKWILMNNNNLIVNENEKIIELLNYYLYINNRSSIIIYRPEDNIELQIDELSERIKNL